MIRGLYTSISGMWSREHRVNVIANNLANADTPGFKRDLTVSKEVPVMDVVSIDDPLPVPEVPPNYVGFMGTGVILDEDFSVHTQGPLEETGSPFDLAISGNGFFLVQDAGGVALTRDGRFSLNGEGYLVNADGNLVLGEGGPIYVGEGKKFYVDERGGVYVDNVLVDRLRVVEPADYRRVKKVGYNKWVLKGTRMVDVENPSVKQGYLEKSNVRVAEEMVELISASRAYEANQRVVRAEDETLSAVIRDVGKV